MSRKGQQHCRDWVCTASQGSQSEVVQSLSATLCSAVMTHIPWSDTESVKLITARQQQLGCSYALLIGEKQMVLSAHLQVCVQDGDTSGISPRTDLI